MADIVLRDSDILSKDYSFKDKISVANNARHICTNRVCRKD